MEPTQTDIIERESRYEADLTPGRDEHEPEITFPSLADDLGWHVEEADASYVSRERVVVHYPNGYDDVDEVEEDEADVTEEI